MEAALLNILNSSFVISVFVLTCLSVADGAKKVDANIRARETMKRRSEMKATKRDVPELNTRDLLQLTEGKKLNVLS